MKCKSHDIVLKGLLLKAPYHSHRSSKITLRASKALLRDRIQFHRFKKSTINKQINDLESFCRSSINQPDHLRIMAAVESSFKHHFLKHKEIQIRKFSVLKHHQATKTPKPIHGSEKFVINLPEHVLTESETSVLKTGLNFAITNRGSSLDMACAAEFARSKLPLALGMEFCWRIRCML
jgi:pantothenate kinase